jgi:3-hydroxyisobutyrate dehydrogenase
LKGENIEMADNSESKPIVGFAGMGGMGSRMALRLIENGYSLHVYNRDPRKTQPLAQRGAVVDKTPRDLASACQVVMLSLADDAALEAVLSGPDGALDTAPAGRIFVDLSTVHPHTSRETFDAAKAKGIGFLDSPVSGSLAAADQGTLLVMVGGDKRTFDEVRPLLDALGRPVVYMGDSGSGTMMKLVINSLLGVSMQAFAEAIALGEKAGLPRDLLLDVLGQTGAVSPGQKAKLEHIHRNEYPPAFPLRLMCKDFNLVLSQAAELGAPMPAAAAAQQMCAAALSAGEGEEDFAAIVRFMEELSRVREKVRA